MNKVILIGRLTKNPEMRHTAGNNIPVCRFNLAVQKRTKSEHPEADFFQIIAWRSTAEFCQKYFVKGLRVCVEGILQNRQWDDNGTKRVITEIIAKEVHFADGKKSDMPASVSQSDTDDGFVALEYDDDLPF